MGRSPYTGWTRDHYELAFARVVSGWRASLSEGGARTALEGGETLPAALEGAARMMPVIAAWLSDRDNPAVIEYAGERLELVTLLRTALLNGTDPTHPEYWGTIVEGWDQTSVEAAWIAEALLLAGDRLWDTFSAPERRQILRWLSRAKSNFPNNWSLFVGVRNLARRELGGSVDEAKMLAQLRALDDHYRGDGWYSDGAGMQVDLYNGHVIHPLRVAWRRSDPEIAPEDAERVEDRLAAYLADLPYLYDRRGRRVPFGRSLAYREGHLSVVALGHVAGVSPLRPGQARRLISGALAHALGPEGRADDGMLDDDDVIRSGWVAQDPRALESYQRPGSQFLAARALMALMIPRDDPFWTRTELPLPADAGNFSHVVPGAGFSLVGIDDGEEVRLLPSRAAKRNVRKYHTRYRKHAYSSRFLPDLVSLENRYPDDMSLQLRRPGAPALLPELARDGTVAPGVMRTVADFVTSTEEGGPRSARRRRTVTTAVSVNDAVIRWTCHHGGAPEDRPVEGGWTAPRLRRGQGRQFDGPGTARLLFEPDVDPANAGWFSAVVGLVGFDHAEVRRDLPGLGRTNMVWDHGITPRLVGPGGTDRCTLGIARAGRVDADRDLGALLERTAAMAGVVAIESDVHAVRLELLGGEGAAWIGGGLLPRRHEVELGPYALSGPLRFAVRFESETATRLGLPELTVAGVRRVRDESGTLLELDRPGTLWVWADGDVLSVELDGPARLRAPCGIPRGGDDACRVRAAALDGNWIDISDDVADGPDGRRRFGPTVFRRLGPDVERTMVHVEIGPQGGS